MRVLLLLAALFAWAAPASAATAIDAPVTAAHSGPTSLFVELLVNGRVADPVANVTQDGDRLLIEADVLRAAGMRITDAGTVDVAHYPGVRADYDAPRQRLLLDLPPAMLPTHHIAPTQDGWLKPIVDTGALLNYDLFVQTANGETVASLWTEQRAFGAFGMVSNTGILRAGAGRHGYVRLDTSYRVSQEGSATELAAGDLISRALPWSTSVRLGGVQLSRRFALRPDLITVPLPSFSGDAAVPTGVDLFVNGYRQSRTDVAPGRFVLDSVPVVNGAGEARIVTTDAVGRQIATVIPFYVAPDLLRPGLTDYSVEAGALRSRYGLASFGYGRIMASASARHGLTDHLTVSGHAEVARGLANGGLGVAWAPGLWGAVSGSVAMSRTDGRDGRQITLGYTYSGQRVAFGIEHVERSGRYADLGTFDLIRLPGSMRSDRASVSVPVGRFGSIGAGYLASHTSDGVRARLVSASWSLPIGRRASAFAAVDYDMRRRTASAQIRFVVPLGRDFVSGGGVSYDRGGAARVQASLARPTPSQGGIGFSADAARDSRGRFLGQASGTWRDSRFQAEGGVAASGGARSAWGGISGSIALLDGEVFAANALPGAFALVSTGMAHVPVFYENQPMGQTDAGGRLFVPRVTPHNPSRFAIDPVDLPIGAIADRTETRVALRAGTGGIVRLPVSFHSSITARIVDAAGAPLPPGTIATLSDGRTTPIGWDGVILLEDMGKHIGIAAMTANGPCRAEARATGEAAMIADIGTIACR